MNNKVIGIFGGSGFLGLELVSELCKSGYQIKIFSRSASDRKSINLIGDLGQISTFTGNVNDQKKVEKFFLSFSHYFLHQLFFYLLIINI